MKFIARLGQNETFVAFMAHSGIAAWIIYAPVHFLNWSLGLMVIGGVLAAAIKEFWFDMAYETNPPQTMEDGLNDFTGYCVGILFGILMLLL